MENKEKRLACWTMKTLGATMLFLLPWTMLEVRPRVIWMDMFFLPWLGSLLWVWWRYWPAHRLPKELVEYGLLLFFWISAVLASGFSVSYATAYLFETLGLIYLSLLSWTVSYAVGILIGFRWSKLVIFASLMGTMLFGLFGLFFGVAGKWPAAFYNNANKLTASFKNPNQLAGFLVLFLPWLFVMARQTSRRFYRFAYVSLALLLLTELLASGSRTGVGTAFFFFLLVGLSFGSRALWRGRLRVNINVLGGMVVLLMIGGTLVWMLQGRIGVINRALSAFQVIASGQIADSFRLQNWRLGLQVFSQYPLTGHGVAQIAAEHPYEIHNTYVSVLAETGLVGFCAFLFVVGYVLCLGWRNVMLTRKEPTWNVVAQGLFWGLVSELIFITQHMFLRSRPLWVWLGLVVAFRVYWTRYRIGKSSLCAE